MKEQLNKVKTHFQEHKEAYIAGASCLAIGAVGTLAVMSSPYVSNRQIQVLTYKSKQVLEVFIEALGDPGNIIQDTTTGIIYASQNQVARELGVSPARISEQLAGKIPDVHGHTFAKLGKAMVKEEVA